MDVLQRCTQTRSLSFYLWCSSLPNLLQVPSDIRGGEVGMVQRWDLLVQTGLDAPQLLKSNWQP